MEVQIQAWTLWQLLKTFGILGIANFLSHIRIVHTKLSDTPKGTEASDPLKSDLRVRCKAVMELLQREETQDAYVIVHSLLSYLSSQMDHSALMVHLERTEHELIRVLNRYTVLHVASDRVAYLNLDEANRVRPFVFSEAVAQAFPSALRDTQEAGYCLATDSNTAAVFHLMRVTEFGLRALATDRNVEFKDKPLSEKEWGQILNSLESKLTGLRQANANAWQNKELREPQIRYYSELVQELRGFNDAWRKHVSHADALAFYDHGHAVSIYGHVRTFMLKLSEKVSEYSQTPEYWQ